MLSQSERYIMLMSLCLFISGTLSINIYLPTLLHLTQVFHTNLDNVKLSISLFLLSYALSQFFWGSLSEKLGRKKTILFGLSFATVGTLLVLLTSNILLFNMGRLIEGFGIGCTSVLARTILTDSLDKPKIAFAMSYISTTISVLPALAPIIGGQLFYWLGWRSIFLFLLIYTLGLLFLFATKLPETHTHIQKDLGFKTMLLQYVEVLSHREFLGYSFPILILSGGLIGYYAATPFIFMSVLHFSAHTYAYFSIIPVSGYTLGVTVSRYFFARFGFDKTILLGFAIALFSTLLAIIAGLTFDISVVTVLIPITLFSLATGLISPCCNAGAMAIMRHQGGASGAALSAGYYLSWAIFSAISTHLSFHSLATMAGYVGVTTILALIGYWKLIVGWASGPTKPSL